MVKTTLKRIGRRLLPPVVRTSSDLAYYAGIYDIGKALYGGAGIIYMLHRVVPDGTPIVYPGYEVSVSDVRAALTAVRRLGWDIVSIEEVAARLARADGRRFVCFTFDDGYLDNFSVALPVFREFRAPLCVYVTTGFLDRSVFYWWGGLEELVTKSDEVVVPETPQTAARRMPARTLAEKRKAFEVLDSLGHRLNDRIFPEFSRMFEKAGIDPQQLLERDTVSAAQLATFSRDPLVTIGSHTVSHPRLAQLPTEQAALELRESRRHLEALLDREIGHLAYPFGRHDACGAREFDLARASGYKTAVTTRSGNIFTEHRSHLTALPRREIPMDALGLRNTLFGVETLLRRQPRFQTE